MMRNYAMSANVGPIRMVKENGGSSIKPQSHGTFYAPSLSTPPYHCSPFCRFVLKPFHFCITIQSFLWKQSLFLSLSLSLSLRMS
ncbi:unnamed protein product [Citrullus colocynthis]|uniref:Uncharacterized protein n=1 Tax=Citrullus colocynthis TaxID=252529 RepID=A0ABP0YKK1_9ROSI